MRHISKLIGNIVSGCIGIISRNQDTQDAVSLQLIMVGKRHVQSPRLSFRRSQN